jgi:hypothetical protein
MTELEHLVMDTLALLREAIDGLDDAGCEVQAEHLTQLEDVLDDGAVVDDGPVVALRPRALVRLLSQLAVALARVQVVPTGRPGFAAVVARQLDALLRARDRYLPDVLRDQRP